MSPEDFEWYHVAYATEDGKIGSTEIGISEDPFVPSDIIKHIKESNNFDFCCIVNWKKLELNQISEDSRNKIKDLE